MSNISDLIKNHTVIVDDGSGVLIQPMTDKYSYILTAKHNILVDYKNSESETKVLAEIKITRLKDESLLQEIEAIEIYKHHTLDIAVIRIDFFQAG